MHPVPNAVTESPQHRIEVSVETAYIARESAPDAGRYVFAYTVLISNRGTVAAQLRSRHWIITDANNQVQEVRGEGVVGEQPHLVPGTSYQYTSGTILATPVGSMRGSYRMAADDGTEFDAEIPVFTLAAPGALN
jgi:ApaG protein